MVIEISNLSGLKKFAAKFAKTLKGGEIIALSGNLGAGKTTFTKMLLKAAGIRHNIASPTFVLMLPYKKERLVIYHIDLYRTSGYKDFAALGVPELWGKKNNIFIIEWADKIKNHLPAKTIWLQFKHTKPNEKFQRQITLKNAAKNFKI